MGTSPQAIKYKIKRINQFNQGQSRNFRNHPYQNYSKMDDNSNEKVFNSIDKLNNDNYSIWSFKIKSYLQEKEVWNVINEDKPVANDKNQDAVATWIKKDQKAYNLIVLSIANNQIIHIKSVKTAKEAWEKLKEEHQKSTLATKIRIYKKIFQTNLKKNQSVRDHVDKLLDLFDQLNELGSPLPKELAVSCVLASLNEDYSSITTAIEAWDEDRLTMKNVKSLLFEEYEKKKMLNINSGLNVNSQVNFKTPDNKQYIQQLPECGYCHKLGHFKKNCYKLQLNRQKSANISNPDCVAVGNTASAINLDEMETWYVDSGASVHVCTNLSYFINLDYSRKRNITVANGFTLCSDGVGDCYLTVKLNDGSYSDFVLYDVLYFQNKRFSNLISVNLLTHEEIKLIFQNNSSKMIVKNKCIQLKQTNNGLYILESYVKRNQGMLLNYRHCIHEWHRILSHRNLNDIKKMQNRGIKFKPCNCSDLCEKCIQGKMSRRSFPNQASKVNSVLDVVVSDVCGPLQTTSIHGYRYFITFIDVFSNYTVVKFLKEKSEAPSKIFEFIEQMKVIFGRKPKIFRSDRGLEYTNQTVQRYLAKEGIHFQTTVGYAPEQNGIAERKNRTLVEAVRTMFADTGLPKNLWPEALNEATYNLNRVFSKHDGSCTPYENFYNKKQDFTDFHEFGSAVYIKIPDVNRRKLDLKAIKCIYLGHDINAKGYRIYDPESRTVKISRDVIFIDKNKNQDKCKDKAQVQDPVEDNSSQELVEDNSSQASKSQESRYFPIILDNSENNQNQAPQAQNPDNQNQENNIEENQENNYEDEEIFHDAEDIQDVIQNQAPVHEEELRRSTRSTAGIPSKHLEDYVTYKVSQNSDPRTFRDAMISPDKDKWIEAMQEELNSLEENETWDLVDLPKFKNPVGSKWVFKRKLNEQNKVVSYKARLVAQGFSQKYGIDYDEVFAPVTRSSTFRMLLTVSAKRKYLVKQFDIKTAFLNGKLQEEIYLSQPPGFKINNQVYKLKKSLYGLKQAARVWNQTIHQVLIDTRFCQSQTDKCLYFKHSDKEACYLIIHVDDIIIAGSSLSVINQVQDTLSQHFQIKDLGSIKFFLGISVDQDELGNYYINQEGYISKIVSEAGLDDAKSSKIPLDPGYYKIKDSELLKSNEEYRKLIGMLLYVSTNSRPDISSSISILSQKVSNPTKTDLNEVKRVIKYLSGTRNYKLKLSTENSEQNLEIYSDANWAEDRVDRKSNSGYIAFLYGGTVSWACRKQSCVSLSSTEAEYVALSETTQEVIWLQRLCQDFSIQVQLPIQVNSDNQSAINMLQSHKFSNSTKHIELRYHFIKDISEQGIIKVKFCPGEFNLADMLTKPLGASKLKELRSKSGVN